MPQRKEDEWTTRRERVDKALREAGWRHIVGFAKGAKYDNEAVREYETAEGPADYVLFHNGEAIAAVEAKKVTIGPQNVLAQALRYSRGFGLVIRGCDGMCRTTQMADNEASATWFSSP